MSFEYADYLYLAEELAGKIPVQPSSAEVKLRSAISRAYYATFLKARNYLENNTRVVIFHDGSDHKTVRDEFLNSRDGKWLKIGRSLKFLLEQRTFADYEETVPNLTTVTNTVLLRANDVLKWLDEL